MKYINCEQLFFRESLKLPPLQPLWKRVWCATRGHGGITPMPGNVYYRHDGLCKRCGSRVQTACVD